MTIDQILLYIVAPLVVMLLALAGAILKVSHRDLMTMRLRGLGISVTIETTERRSTPIPGMPANSATNKE